MSDLVFTITGGCLLLWSGAAFMSSGKSSSRELSRFTSLDTSFVGGISQSINDLATKLASGQDNKSSNTAAEKAKITEMERKLQDAGLSSTTSKGKFILFKIACYVLFPFVGASTYLSLPAYYATVTTLILSIIGLLTPIVWLKAKAQKRNEAIQRELPLVLDLTNLATSAGWDVGSALDRVIDALAFEMPYHPLIRELKKARWLAASGYTWEEALQKVSEKLSDDTVRRTTLALGQAIKQGGDRTAQLEGIAQDAHRVYYSELDKRLAGLQVKGVLITMVLFVAYLMILMAPAVVSIKAVVVK